MPSQSCGPGLVALDHLDEQGPQHHTVNSGEMTERGGSELKPQNDRNGQRQETESGFPLFLTEVDGSDPRSRSDLFTENDY